MPVLTYWAVCGCNSMNRIWHSLLPDTTEISMQSDKQITDCQPFSWISYFVGINQSLVFFPPSCSSPLPSPLRYPKSLLEPRQILRRLCHSFLYILSFFRLCLMPSFSPEIQLLLCMQGSLRAYVPSFSQLSWELNTLPPWHLHPMLVWEMRLQIETTPMSGAQLMLCIMCSAFTYRCWRRAK